MRFKESIAFFDGLETIHLYNISQWSYNFYSLLIIELLSKLTSTTRSILLFQVICESLEMYSILY